MIRFKKTDVSSKRVVLILAIASGLMLLAGLGYLAASRSGVLDTLRIAKELQDQEKLSQEDKKVLTRLNKIIDLPEDVIPIMAVVTDAEALKNENPAIFASAKKGDRVIIYPSLVILYDYKANKIMGIGPVVFGDGSGGTETTSEGDNLSSIVSLAVFDGSGGSRNLENFVSEIEGDFENADVIQTGEAANIYDRTIVVDLTGHTDFARDIAYMYGGELSGIPFGEEFDTEADILIIMGSDG